jgi:hypothetical protein
MTPILIAKGSKFHVISDSGVDISKRFYKIDLKKKIRPQTSDLLLGF